MCAFVCVCACVCVRVSVSVFVYVSVFVSVSVSMMLIHEGKECMALLRFDRANILPAAVGPGGSNPGHLPSLLVLPFEITFHSTSSASASLLDVAAIESTMGMPSAGQPFGCWGADGVQRRGRKYKVDVGRTVGK